MAQPLRRRGVGEAMIRDGFAVFGLLALLYAIGRYLLVQGRRSVTKAGRERLMRRLERL